ncbi:hypothetical protein NDU88_003603 [Pleurodeles waltl]|uniref:Uncharacterized protein n=1 Tax=Pleurodeles waltl TaxID=8319 RepID=A0AAV7MR19_PLEWA|nr:hypothetical protein NDU88_003603 [Pleurodeles waltl]
MCRLRPRPELRQRKIAGCHARPRRDLRSTAPYQPGPPTPDPIPIRPLPGSVLLAQCRVPEAIRRAPEKFVCRQPGRYQRPPGGSLSRPRIQALSSASHSALSKRLLSTGPRSLLPGPGDLKARRETPAGGRERPTRSGPQPPHAPGSNQQEKGGGGEPRCDTTADQAPPKSLALPSSLPSTGGGGRSLPSLRAHRGSRHAQQTAGARPLGTPPPPGCQQQPNPAQTASSESLGGSPRGPLLHRRP